MLGKAYHVRSPFAKASNEMMHNKVARIIPAILSPSQAPFAKA